MNVIKHDKKWYQAHRPQLLEYQRKYYHSHKENHNKYIRKYRKRKWMKIKTEIFYLLDNKCANPFNLPHPDWCNDPRCLQIDHVHGGGTKEIKEYGRGLDYIKKVLKEIKDGSKDYQILCANCNWIKRYENNEFTFWRA